jgi:hypothetical protein
MRQSDGAGSYIIVSPDSWHTDRQVSARSSLFSFGRRFQRDLCVRFDWICSGFSFLEED